MTASLLKQFITANPEFENLSKKAQIQMLKDHITNLERQLELEDEIDQSSQKPIWEL
jgi:hypothetical protein